MSSYCINLNPPEPMTCKSVPIARSLYKCWLVENSYMLFSEGGISYECIELILGSYPSYTPSELFNRLSEYGLVRTSCLYLELVDSQVDIGRIYTSLYEAYKHEVKPLLEELNQERSIDNRISVRHKYNMGYIGCGCNGNESKPPKLLPSPPFPPEHKSQCICINYKNKTMHFTSNMPLSNLLVEEVLRSNEVSNINQFLLYLRPILIESNVIGVINGVLK